MDIHFILASMGVFLTVIILLVIILLVAKKYLSPSGNVKITINNDTVLDVPQGNSVMATLNENGIYLPSACGGKASCGQCKVQVLEGGGEILDSEKSHFSRKEIKEGWRLGCQCKVKGDLKLHVDESVMGVKEWECTVISNRNVATFIKEYKVALPPGEHMNFEPGSYAQIRIPAFELDYNTDFDKSLIRDTYLHGRSLDSSLSSAQTLNQPFVPTPWQTTLMRAISSLLTCVSLLLLSNQKSRDLALWT